MSDNTEIWRVMNGLASWFNGQSGLIQSAAWMGALMLLAIATFNAAIGKGSAGAAQIGGWFFFMTMMGMTGTANIINIYTGAVTTVANVPALVLIPSSMFSKAGYKVFQSMETAFQATTGSYMSISQNAFVGPLDVLLSLRSPKLPAAIPALNQTLIQVLNDCGENPEATSAASQGYNDALDVLDWFTTNGRQTGLTTIYQDTDTTGAGTISSCADGLNYINNHFSTLAGGDPKLVSFINAQTAKFNPQNTNGLWGGASIGNSFDFIVGSAVGMTQSSLQFTKNALTAGIVSYTMDCLKSAGAITSADNCQTGATAMADSMERMKTDTAMNGSGFLKTMFTSMGFLQVIFFSLFPFIAIYGLVVVNKTLSVFGSYILFGIWSQSWLLVVAPIQSYIQTSVITEMSKIMATSHGMTPANSSAVYQTLSTKLMLASDLMANSQMLSLALLSGSIYALTGMVGKWSGSQHNDGSMLENKISDSASIVKNNPMISASTMSTSSGRAMTSTESYGSPGFALESSWQSTANTGSGTTTANVSTHSRAKQLQLAKSLAAEFGLTESQAAGLVQSLDAGFSGTAGISSGIAKDMVGALFKGKTLTAAQTAAAEKTAMQAQGNAVAKLAAKDSSFLSKLSSSDAAIKSEAWSKVAGYAMDALTVGAVGLELMSGVGAVASVETAAIGAGMKTGVMSGVRNMLAKQAPKVAKAESAAVQAMGTAGNYVGNVADAVAGNVKAGLSATLNKGMKEIESTDAKKTSSTSDKLTATQSDAILDTFAASKTQTFNETTGKGTTDLMKMTLTNESLNAIGVNGMNDGRKHISGQYLRQGAALTSSQYRNGGILKSDGTRFSADEIAFADKQSDLMLAGKSSFSNDPNVTSTELHAFKKNMLFEQILTGGINNSMSKGAGLSRGADIQTEQPKTTSTPAVAAVTGTKGHWESIKHPGKLMTAKQDKYNLTKWGDGDKADAKTHAAAAHAGMRWVPGVAAVKAKPASGNSLLPDPSETHRHLPTNAPRGNIGGDFGNKEAQALENKVRAFEAKNHIKIMTGTDSAREALAKLSPTKFAEFNSFKDKTELAIGVGAAVSMVAGGVAGVGKGKVDAEKQILADPRAKREAEKTATTPSTPAAPPTPATTRQYRVPPRVRSNP